MPKNTRKPVSRKKGRIRQPNVFAQTEPTSPELSDEGEVATASATDAAPRVRARVERVTRRASARSEIYTRSLSAELKKMGALASVIVVALIILTFVL